MDTRQITLTLPKIQVAQLNALVEAGRIESVSEFMQLVVRKALINEMLWRETVDRIMEESGGSLTPEDEAWVQSMLAKQREPVITSDPDDIRLLDSTIEIVPISQTGR